ncbi:fimbria/pilus outer membrane usher protein [Azospirillum soli]|uniref:fimbria/pilus outer membrane usher protein n=1 Tax=Azospirillum soli TaxID=1304799 RepID=UPI001AE4D3D1|nr:fimbria/pilus outer membrane usher protein [Azospirillum soli]MBP2313878.1 outer membrane usher protein [Azospirillum soli]
MLLAVALCSLALPAHGQTPAKSTEDIYQQVFGKKKGASATASAVRDMMVPVLVNGREAGMVPARIAADPKQTTVALRPLLETLAPLVQPAVLEKLRAVKEEQLPPARLAGNGMDIAYEATEIAVVVKLDPEARKTVDLDLGGAPRPPTGNMALEPADFSALTNITVNEEWISYSDNRPNGGRRPLRTAFAHALNVGGFVVEANTFYQEDGFDRWQRGDARATVDWTDAAVRISAGDVTFPVSGFQAGQRIGGFVVGRNFALQPYTLFQPAGQQEFVLTSPSVVDVQVNGRPTRSYRLPAGPYSLRNFPGTLGANDVTVRITDEFGRTQTIDVPFFFDSQLLGEGVHDFTYAGGLPTTVNQGTYRYDRGQPTGSARHRYGVTDQLTLGLNAQGNPDQRMFGGEVLFASPIGTIGIEPAVSDGRTLPRDYAVQINYRNFTTGDQFWKQRTVTALATWRGPNFAQLGTTQPRNPVKLDLGGRITQPLADWVTASVSGRYQYSRDPTLSDTSSVELALRTRIAPGASVDLSVEQSRRTNGEMETAMFASLRYSFDGSRQTIGARTDTRNQSRELDWRLRSTEMTNALDAGLRVRRDRDGYGADGDASFLHQRFTANARSTYLSQLNDSGTGMSPRSYDRSSALTFSTALLFADGYVGVSRPVNDSFAIVAPHPRLADKQIGVDPYNQRYAAETDLLGAPVLPDLSAYRQRAFLLDVPDAPVSYDLGNDRPVLVPRYRSGTVVPIGTDATASLSGVLKGEDGKPLGLQSGVLRPADGSGAAEIAFFTNRQGRFRVEGVRPGRWTLVIHGMEDRPKTLTVPADGDTIDLGEVKP